MNAGRAINMIIRMVANRFINVGINKGVDAMAKRQNRPDATPEQKKKSHETTQRMRQAIRIIRRMGRF